MLKTGEDAPTFMNMAIMWKRGCFPTVNKPRKPAILGDFNVHSFKYSCSAFGEPDL